jgi:NADH dehydrogenase [ubiquinone] 1 alpha subcomplex assembly factor 6
MATIPGSVNNGSRKTPVPERRSADANRLSPVVALVRRHDHDRFQTALFAPAARREALFALYAFNYEIARVRESVAEPMLGQIRLQWWRENIAIAVDGGIVRRHFVVEPLTAAIRELELSRQQFDQLIDAREADLQDGPPADLAALEGYAEATSARLIYLALEILGSRQPAAAETAYHVGVGYALAGLLRAMPFQARAGRRLIPMKIAARSRLDEQDYYALRSTPALSAATAELAAAASRHLDSARAHRVNIPRSAVAALLPGVIARHWLTRLKSARYDPFDRSLASSDPLQSWRLAAAALLRRF